LTNLASELILSRPENHLFLLVNHNSSSGNKDKYSKEASAPGAIIFVTKGEFLVKDYKLNVFYISSN